MSALVFGTTAPAVAHTGGKADPNIETRISVSECCPSIATISVIAIDSDSPEPIRRATVTAQATETTPVATASEKVTFAETGEPGHYSGSVALPAPGNWTFTVSVEGSAINTALDTKIVSVPPPALSPSAETTAAQGSNAPGRGPGSTYLVGAVVLTTLIVFAAVAATIAWHRRRPEDG
jgi:hypothetical protein